MYVVYCRLGHRNFSKSSRAILVVKTRKTSRSRDFVRFGRYIYYYYYLYFFFWQFWSRWTKHMWSGKNKWTREDRIKEGRGGFEVMGDARGAELSGAGGVYQRKREHVGSFGSIAASSSPGRVQQLRVMCVDVSVSVAHSCPNRAYCHHHNFKSKKYGWSIEIHLIYSVKSLGSDLSFEPDYRTTSKYHGRACKGFNIRVCLCLHWGN